MAVKTALLPAPTVGAPVSVTVTSGLCEPTVAVAVLLAMRGSLSADTASVSLTGPVVPDLTVTGMVNVKTPFTASDGTSIDAPSAVGQIPPPVPTQVMLPPAASPGLKVFAMLMPSETAGPLLVTTAVNAAAVPPASGPLGGVAETLKSAETTVAVAKKLSAA